MNRKLLSFSARVLMMGIIISVLLLFVGIVFLVLLHIFIRGRASRREGSGRNGEGRNMSIEDIEKLPCYDYIANDNTRSPVNCAVCLENLNRGDKCRLLPMCKHSFHAQCVDTWLLKKPICPICRSSAGSQRGGELGENPNTGHREVESREHQADTVENQVTSATSLSHAVESAAL